MRIPSHPLLAIVAAAVLTAPAAGATASDERIVVDGLLRSYVLHVPAGVPRGVVIACHGGGSNGRELWDRHWHRQADRGAIIACPTAQVGGVGLTNWVALGDRAKDPAIDELRDERFLLALRARWPRLPAYACGFSSGAKMTHHLYVRCGGSFAGFAMVGRGIAEAQAAVTPAVLRPLRFTMGSEDPNHDAPGDGVLDAAATRAWYGALLPGPLRARTVAGAVTSARIVACASSPPSCYVRIDGMGHRWPTLRDGDPFDEDAELMRWWRLADVTAR
ncbi:MAG TPA: hypothetical protein VEL07_10380 [Planctomycetota bacterium]|nr:hypothetical protein [Planctomycetota bacterium]